MGARVIETAAGAASRPGGAEHATAFAVTAERVRYGCPF
jgi:hypothetical protein